MIFVLLCLFGQAASELVQVVLDDAKAGCKAAHQTFEGTFLPCLEDAYEGQFHHDWGKNKGNAHFAIKFDPPESGCYQIEEYHPGGNALCSPYMVQNARLDVDYCNGLSKTFTINQAEKPAEWNKVGELMFYEGNVGRLIMSNSVNEQCGVAECFMVADAFRLTKVADSCSRAQVLESKPKPTSPYTKGLLRLALTSSDGRADKSGMAAEMQLRRHGSEIEMTLLAHYGFEQVKIQGFRAVSGRRLQRADEGASQLLDVRFGAYGGNTEESDLATLRTLLNAKLSGSGVEVADAEVHWGKAAEFVLVEPPAGIAAWIFVVAFSAVALALLIPTIIFVRRRCARGAGQHAADDKAAPSKAEAATNEVLVTEKAAGEVQAGADDKDVEAASVSTTEELQGASELISSSSEEGKSNDDEARAASPKEQAEVGEQVLNTVV